MMRQTPSSEAASLPLTLLVAIVLGGLIAALFTIVSSGVRSSARDRDFAQAIQVADAGVQEASVALERLIRFDEVPTCDVPDWFLADDVAATNTPTSGACIGEMGLEGSFDWSYECDDATCEVLSVGRFRNSSRAVQMEYTTTAIPNLGITGIEEAFWAGGGGFDGEFTMGTFGCIRLPASADGLVGFWYYGDSLEEDRNRGGCWGPGQRVNDVNDGGLFLGVATPPVVADQAVAFCDVPEAILANLPPQAPSEAFCVREARFPPGFDFDAFRGAHQSVSIYVVPGVTGNVVSVAAGGTGNNALADDVNAAGDPSRLRVYASSGGIEFRNNAVVSMHLVAPNSECDVFPNGDYTGTILCEDVKIRGNYAFVGPEGSVDPGPPRVESWSEEVVPASRRAVASG